MALSPEGATFAPRRLGGGRRTPPTLAIAWLAVLGGFVALAVAGRPEGGVGFPGASRGIPGGLGVGGVPAPTQAIAPNPIGGLTESGPRPTRRPRISSGPGPVQLEVVRMAGSVFVHGDIHAERVVWVFVSVHGDSGRVAGWASLSFPGSIGSAVESTPALRFDVELVIPDDMRAERLWAQANVYDTLGRRVGTARLEMPPLGTPVGLHASPGPTEPVSAVLRGFRPGAHFPLLDASFDDEPSSARE